VQEGTLHPDAYEEILRPEYDRLGLEFLTQPGNEVRQEIDATDLVITQSEFARSTYLAAGVPSDKVVAVPLGIDKSLFHPVPRSRKGDTPLQLLYVGMLSIRKGIQHLLAAMQQLPPEVAELTLVGTMHEEFVPIWKRMAPLFRSRVSWKGGVARTDLPALYRVADVMVLPSLCDSFGQVVLEALACGTPVIATANCGAQPRPGVDGLVVPAGNSEALTHAIHQLWENRDLLSRMSLLAPEGVRTWQDFQSDFLDLTAHLVRERIGAGSEQTLDVDPTRDAEIKLTSE
jgi:glycosyltransferase involved in cell wall biosynthesis